MAAEGYGDYHRPSSAEEIIEIKLKRSDKEGLGFNIRGGYDMPHIPGDSGIFVTKIREDGAAATDGRLSEGDKIIQINGQSLENLDHRTAVTMFKRAGPDVVLRVLKGAERKIQDATSQKINPRASQSDVRGAVLIGLGAAVLLGFSLYKFRGHIFKVFQRFTQSKPDHLKRLVYQPYTPKY